MARVIFGDADEFDVLAFGRPHQNTIQFLNNHAQQVSQNLTQHAANFMDNLGAIYNYVNYDALNEMAYALNRKVESIWDRNNVQSFVELAQLQNADLFNQRWIMACPDIRELYHAQQCNGFHGSYVDVQPNAIGFHHYDYRRATDELVMFTDEGWEATTYYEDLHPDDRHLLLAEKTDIQIMWEAARYFVKHGHKDPTSPTDDPL